MATDRARIIAGNTNERPPARLLEDFIYLDREARVAYWAIDGEWAVLAKASPTAGDIDSEDATGGYLLAADGTGGAEWVDPEGEGDGGGE